MTQVRYLEDLPIDDPSILARSKTRHEHWLEPCHGPPPDHLGRLEYGPEDVICALWMDRWCCMVAFDIPHRHRTPEEEAWLLKNTRGWILQTRRWRADDDGVFRLGNGEAEVALVDFEEDGEWRLRIYREIMVMTVASVMETPIGANTQSLTNM